MLLTSNILGPHCTVHLPLAALLSGTLTATGCPAAAVLCRPRRQLDVSREPTPTSPPLAHGTLSAHSPFS